MGGTGVSRYRITLLTQMIVHSNVGLHLKKMQADIVNYYKSTYICTQLNTEIENHDSCELYRI